MNVSPVSHQFSTLKEYSNKRAYFLLESTSFKKGLLLVKKSPISKLSRNFILFIVLFHKWRRLFFCNNVSDSLRNGFIINEIELKMEYDMSSSYSFISENNFEILFSVGCQEFSRDRISCLQMNAAESFGCC